MRARLRAIDVKPPIVSPPTLTLPYIAGIAGWCVRPVRGRASAAHLL